MRFACGRVKNTRSTVVRESLTNDGDNNMASHSHRVNIKLFGDYKEVISLILQLRQLDLNTVKVT